MRAITLLVLLCSVGFVQAWDDARLSQPLIIQGVQTSYPVFAIYPLPGDRINLHWQDRSSGMVRHLDREFAIGTDTLQAPRKPGISRLQVTHEGSGEVARITLFTRIPASEISADGHLRGYRIDRYPAEPLRGLDIYLPPRGFVQVTAKNAQERVSPNFRLGQFVSKQQGGYPKFLVLSPRLLIKLETILTQLNRRSRRTERLVIMSGYRTPFYNRAIGNVKYSRHVWGGAADIYIDDNPRDGRMDDLNGDGRRNFEDARWFADFVDGLSARGMFGADIGGLGVYGANAAHGPFIHVDVRGSRARW